MQAAEIALNAEGKQVPGYVTTHRQSYGAAMRGIDALRNPRRPGPRRESQTRTDPSTVAMATYIADEVEAPAVVTADAEAAVVPEARCSDCGLRVEATPESVPLTEVDWAGDSMLEPAGEAFLATEPELPDELAMAAESFFTTEPEPLVDESCFTTEPELSDEPPIVLRGGIHATNLSGSIATPEPLPRESLEAPNCKLELPPLDPKVVAATEKIGDRIYQAKRARLEQGREKLLAELDAQEARDRAEFAASIEAKYGVRLPWAQPNDGSKPDAPWAPPGGDAPAG